MTSVVQTMNRQQFKQDIEATFVERAVHNLAENAFQDLLRQLRHNEITSSQAARVWKVKRACYDCCMKAVREGRRL